MLAQCKKMLKIKKIHRMAICYIKSYFKFKSYNVHTSAVPKKAPPRKRDNSMRFLSFGFFMNQ